MDQAADLRDDWKAAVAATVRTDDPAAALERLRTTTYDGLTLEPLYTPADTTAEPTPPGVAPFARGRRAIAGDATERAWAIRQPVHTADPTGRALEELERGASALWLHVDDPADIAPTIDGVLLDAAAITLASGRSWPEAAAALVAVWDDADISPIAGGSLGADPLGDHFSDPTTVDVAAELATAADWATRLAGRAPGTHTLTIDGCRYHERGASDATELAATIAAAAATVRALAAAGVADPFAAIELRIAATADQFATIAKLRALRILWGRVAELAGDAAAAGRSPVHAVASRAMHTAYDPAVNVLRSTVACFAAAAGGADAITLWPFDTLSSDEPSELGRRLARNTQSILMLESHLPAVVDPAGGSWYVERRTAELATAAWEQLREIEAAGEFVAALDVGVITTLIDATVAARDDDIAHRRQPLTGVSSYPNVAEPPPASSTDAFVHVARWAEPFEALRRRVDARTADVGTRPSVYLATIGSAAEHGARLAFAANLYGVAGLDTPRGPVDEYSPDVAPAACVCADRKADPAVVDAAVAALQTAGASYVDVAGRDAVVAGGDALAHLTTVLDRLEIA